MEPELDLGVAAADALLEVRVGSLSRQQLALGVIRVQQIIDRFTLAHAQFMAAADKAGVWQGTGARDMADWLTNTTQTSYGSAKGLIELGDGLVSGWRREDRRAGQALPLWPKPPPRSSPSSELTTAHCTSSTFCSTNCAIRSPRWMRNSARGSVLSSTTLISPR